MSQQTLDGFALSPQQRRLFLLQAGGGEAAFRAQAVLRLVGPLDLGRLRRAFAELIDRQEILRTVFQRLPGMKTPLQVVAQVAEVPRGWPPAPPESAADAPLWMERARQVPIDLERGPVLRWAVQALSLHEHLLLLDLPSLCADAAGLENLARELARLYAGEALAEPLQYVDLAAWQNELLTAPETEPGRAHWQSLDLGAAAETRLPFELPGGDRFRAEATAFRLSPELARSIAAASARWGVAARTLLFGAWGLLLARLLGDGNESRPVWVGVGFDGRSYSELEPALGLFARTLPVALSAAAGLPVAEVLRRADEALREAGKWQDCFSWTLVQGEDDPGHSLPFAFEVLEGPPALALGHEGLRALFLSRAACHDPFRLKLACLTEGDGDWTVELHRDPAFYDARTVAQLAARFERLLASLCEAEAGTAADALELLPEAERRELLEERNAVAGEMPATAVHLVISQVAAERPAAPAVLFRGDALSYGDLERQAGRLAARLVRLGVAPGDLVGICLPRGFGLVTAILGALKAGAAYLPLDPEYPVERLALILEDSGATALVSWPGCPGDLGAGLRLLDVEAVGDAPDRVFLPEVSPDHPAYAIYTSGSSGRPRGVLVSHRNLAASTAARRQFYGEPVGGFLLLSSCSFDSSVAGLFWTLSDGGALCLPEEGPQSDPSALARLIEGHSLSHLLALPSLYDLLLQEARPEQLASLRAVIVAGEACPPSVVERHGERLPGVPLYNEYGPTEGTVWSTVARCRPGTAVTIGRPVPGVRVYLLDGDLAPVPDGGLGEIFLGGAGIVPGYLGLPDLTADRFLPDPFQGVGERLYRTGDLGRYRRDGEIEFLGRRDHQVKIRGVRIELGEIEAALGRCPGVLQAVAAVFVDQGEPGLVAYLCAPGELPLTIEGLREHLLRSLPAPMVPSVFVRIEALPLLPNGKVDRAALPDPRQGRLEAPGAATAPRTPTEETLTALWEDLLGIESVGVRDDFFALGGHSLVATQLMSWVQRIFHVDMPVRGLFEAPTVAGLAERVDTLVASGEGREIPPLTPAAEGSERPLSFSQERLWFLEQLRPGGSDLNIPVGLRLSGSLDREALDRALAEVERRHEVLRTRFPSVAGEARQEIAPSRPTVLRFLDLGGQGGLDPEERAREIGLAEALEPFDLATGPLLRALLIRQDEETHVLVLVLHHIVADFLSLSILVQETARLYRAFVAGEPSPLEDLPLQYGDFAFWQRGWLSGEVLERELAHWRRQLGGGIPTLDLPTDRPRPPIHVSRGSRVPVSLNAEETAALRSLGRGEAATLFMVVAAAFKVLLRTYSGKERIVVGTNVANRRREETQRLIGLFINQLVLCTDLSSGLTFRELLARVRETALTAYAHQDLPFEKLVEELQPERDLSRPLLFEVKVEVQPPAPSPPDLSGLSLAMIPLDRGVVRYDLHLSLTDYKDRLAGWLQYSTDLFEPETADRIRRDLEAVLARIAAEPEVTVGALEAMLVERRRQDEQARLGERKKANLEDLARIRRRPASVVEEAR